jgi:hypothetical protein
MMKKTIFPAIAALLLLSCVTKEEDQPAVSLTLEKTGVEMVEQSSPVTVAIRSGNGGYSAVSSAPGVATATIAGDGVRITPLAFGTATVTVSDNSPNTAQIAVKVTSLALENSARRFEFGSTRILFGVDHNWTVAGKAGAVEVVNIGAAASYFITWDGGGGIGKKTNAVLHCNTAPSANLPNAEIIAIKNGLYYLVFDGGTLVN